MSMIFGHVHRANIQQSLMSWVQAICRLTHGQVIDADGKTLPGCHDQTNGKSAIHMVSAWAAANGIVLGQMNSGPGKK